MQSPCGIGTLALGMAIIAAAANPHIQTTVWDLLDAIKSRIDDGTLPSDPGNSSVDDFKLGKR
jgi:hypothetical protein